MQTAPSRAGLWAIPFVSSFLLLFPRTAPAACAIIQIQLTMVENGPVGDSNYQFQISASGGAAPYTFTSFGSVPGVSVSATNSNTLFYKGTPTQAGSFSIGATATDTNGCASGPQTFPITINPVIFLSPNLLGAGTVGLPYKRTIYVIGGSPPYRFNGGSFPGVNLITNSDGNAAGYCMLSGIPTTAGTFPITVSVADSSTNTTAAAYGNSIFSPPHLQLSLTNGGISVSWPGAPTAGPFIIQSTPQLTNPVWTNVFTTFVSPIQLPLLSSNGFFRLSLPVIPLDSTDYTQGRTNTAAYYFQNPQTYWSQFGLPSLSRLGNLDATLGVDPTNAFGGVMTAFDPSKFGNALQGGQLPLDFSNVVYLAIQSGQPTNEAIVNGFCSLVSNLDNYISISNETLTVSTYQEFSTVYTNTFNGSQVDILFGPITNKPPSFLPFTNISWVDQHGSDSFTTHPLPLAGPGSGNTNTSTNVAWGHISTSPANVSYDAACSALATGASLAKIDPVFPKSTTPQFWNQLSMQLGASIGSTGAYIDDINAYYGTAGFSSSEAYTGPFETALQEAYNALARGCDVTLNYLSADGQHAHIEMVTQIDMDANSSQRGTVHTLSWGQSATTTYNSGEFSGKSDSFRYGSGGSWIGSKGKATFYYHCPE